LFIRVLVAECVTPVLGLLYRSAVRAAGALHALEAGRRSRFKGRGWVVLWRAPDVRPLVLRRRASRPQLKRDPLGASMPASTCISASMTSVLTTVLAAVACLCAAPPIATAQRIAPTPARTMERTFKIGNSTILEAE